VHIGFEEGIKTVFLESAASEILKKLSFRPYSKN
jgi:hypothetical protein